MQGSKPNADQSNVLPCLLVHGLPLVKYCQLLVNHVQINHGLPYSLALCQMLPFRKLQAKALPYPLG